MRLSRTGSVIGAAYVVLAVASMVYGNSLPDPKDSTVLMQLPIAPAITLLDVLGLAGWLAETSWTVAGGLFVPAIALTLYAVCWLFGALSIRTRLVVSAATLFVVAVLMFWPVAR